MEQFIQGQRLRDKDLVLYLYHHIPYNIINLCVPFWVRYSVGYIHPPTNKFLLIGPKNRIPIIEVGRVRPNFIIGRRWKPGIYEIFWRYKVYEHSQVETKRVRFEVVSDGVTQSLLTMGNYQDLLAELSVV